MKNVKNDLSVGVRESIDKEKMIVVIDMGYLMFYRLHASQRWMSFQSDFTTIEAVPFDKICDIFEKHLISQLDKLKKQYNKARQFFFCRDAKHADVWRNDHYDQYKATRGEATPLIGMVKEIFLRVVSKYGIILESHRLEADDVAYLTVKRLRERDATEEIVIITSDQDYLQMTDTYTSIFNGMGKAVTGSGDPQVDLITKMLMGDVSDNIPAVCKGCGKKTAMLLAKDEVKREAYLVKNKCKEAYEKNRLLICMEEIPKELCDQFYESYSEILI